ncbi:hypothetical protein [Actinomadura harenae]|uniref:Uncharacterized protein n=1 Tax=Actinomadura harenae TaxID=2483351 RepID=A0A3M2M617_9ACTN|nr:hypothetical protein [Actinomadura harenae]RMI44952.1 hypothetical protein EBO15_11830 [Actinomadura harenae]
MLGLFLAAGGLGAFLGSTAAPALVRRLGFGRALWLVGIGVAPFALLTAQIRQRAGRCPNPVTAVIDTQSVKATETAAKTRVPR